MPDGFRIATAFVQVSPDTEGFKEQLEAALEEATAGTGASVRVDLDTSELDAKADEARATVDELDGATATPQVGLDDAELEAKADEAKATLDELDAVSARPEVTLETADLDAKVDEAKATLDDLDTKRSAPKLDLDTADFEAKLAAAQAQLDAFREQTATAKVGGSGGGGHGGGGGGEEGGFLGSIALGAGALLPGIGGAVTGIGLLGLAGGLALGPVGTALEAAHQASLNVGLTPQQLASTAFSNQVQQVQGQQSVTQAREQAAQDAITSAQSIESAEMNLASVQRNAAASQVQALQSVEQAQQGVQQANYGLSEAQYTLTQAWVQAREQITQLDDQLADSKLNVAAASLAVQQAERQQILTDQNAYSTSLDRQQAALAVLQAQQQLKDAQDQETASAYAANLANKQGVAGSQTVIQAKQGVVAATAAQKDAQAQAAIAQQALTDTELNNAAQVKQAQLQLSAAQEQAAYQQRMDAQQVAFAERNLTDTIREQQLQWAATASTENEAANQLSKDMSRLTPEGRSFVEQILGMKGAFKGLQAAAQNSVLPGMSIWLTGISKLLPDVTSGVGRMGSAMGASFAEFGKKMATPQFATVLNGLISNGLRFADIVLPAFAQFVMELGLIGSKKGAVDGIASVLAGIAHAATGLAAVVGQKQGPINAFLEAAGHVIAAIGPGLGEIIGLVATALGPLSRYLNEHSNGDVVKVLGGIAAGLLTLKTLTKWVKGPFEAISSGYELISGIPGKLSKGWGALAGIPGKISKAWEGAGETWVKITTAAQTWSQNISEGFGQAWVNATTAAQTWGENVSEFAGNAASAIGRWGGAVGEAMGNAASATGQFVSKYILGNAAADTATAEGAAAHTAATDLFVAENEAQTLSATEAFIAENAATLGIVAGIAVLVAAIVWMATHWRETWSAIETAALWLWHNVLDPMWHGIASGAMWLYDNGILPMWHGIESAFGWIESAADHLWHDVFDPMWHGIESGASAFVHALGSVWSGLESVFTAPVNFLITKVYDDGIKSLWNGVVTAVNLPGLDLPNIPKLAGGGVLPGYAPGRDTQLTLLSPGEGVLVPEAVQAIGPGTVHQLNATYGKGRTSQGAHFSGGGILNTVGGVLAVPGLAAESAASGASGIGKIAAALATGNGTALTNALDAFVGTRAAGHLGQLMLGLPKSLINSAVQQIVGILGGGNATSAASAVGSGAASLLAAGSVASWFQQAVKLTGVGAGWIPDLETIAHYESSDNPQAINLTDSNAMAGDPSRGIMQTIMTTFDAYHQPGTSSNIFDPVANIAAAINYIKARYGTVGRVPGIVSLAEGGPYVGYDSGGWLMPSGMPVNGLGKPEAVLTPEESRAFVAIVKNLTGQGTQGATALGAKPVAVNFYGTQYPTAEQLAILKREMAMALSGP